MNNTYKLEYKLKYKLENKLGSGAFADVYRCIDSINNQAHAAKVFRENRLINTTNRSKPNITVFEREIEINNKLDHRNIVKLIDFYENPKPTLIFEFVNSGELFFHIEKCGRFSEKDASICVLQILQCVENFGPAPKIGDFWRFSE